MTITSREVYPVKGRPSRKAKPKPVHRLIMVPGGCTIKCGLVMIGARNATWDPEKATCKKCRRSIK